MKPTAWQALNRYRYLLIATAAILVAVTVLLAMQYRSVGRARDHATATSLANLELQLSEITAEAKRGILDHAIHIMHGVRQKRVRDRETDVLERTFTRLVRRYPEVDEFYVVFFERGREDETWNAQKFVPPDPNDAAVKRHNGIPVGSLRSDPSVSEALRRAWNSIDHETDSKIFAAFDPAADKGGRQFFIHTVTENDRLGRTDSLELIGLLAFSARPEVFPSADYLPGVIAKAGEFDRSFGATPPVEFSITVATARGPVELLPANGKAPSLKRSFESADKLFPNLVFGANSADLDAQAGFDDFFGSSNVLGMMALVAALFGIALAWRAARREMQVAQLKSDFLANISHELKTPLTSIRAFGDLLSSGRASNPGRIRQYGSIIKSESDRLTALINNILEMSKHERCIRKYRLDEGDLGALVAETVDVFRHSAEIPETAITVAIPVTPITARFDHGAIRQAVINLLSNAVKYSKISSDLKIDVDVRPEALSAIIEVRDSGIGISKADLSEIFLPFRRSRNAEIQATRGTGLGLAIVYEIARGHGGSVTAESEPGKGSAFRLELPLIDGIGDAKSEKDGSYTGYRRRSERRYRAARQS
jgi:signal transduction histidine kinase